jgi:hypothetical protein
MELLLILIYVSICVAVFKIFRIRRELGFSPSATPIRHRELRRT